MQHVSGKAPEARALCTRQSLEIHVEDLVRERDMISVAITYM